MKRMLPGLAVVVGLGILVGAGYWMFRPGAGEPVIPVGGDGNEGQGVRPPAVDVTPPVGGGDGAGATGVVDVRTPVGVPRLPPEYYQANTIVSKAFSTNAELGATLVTVNFDELEAMAAMGRLMEAGGVPSSPSRGNPRRGATPTGASLHLRQQPFLEGVLQLEAQASLSVTTTANGEMSASFAGHGPGIWCVSGPFAFAIQTISHGVGVDREGRPTAMRGGGRGGAADPLTLTLTTLVEPRLHILQSPTGITIMEAVDDRDHSLVAAAAMPAGRGGPASSNAPLRVTLAYPASNAGRRIAVLKGTAAYTVQLKGQTVTVEDPFNAPASEQTLAGMVATIGPATWNEATQTMNLPVSYRRGTFAGDWATMVRGLAGIQPVIGQPGDGAARGTAGVRGTRVAAPTQREEGDAAVVTYGIRFGVMMGVPVGPGPLTMPAGRPEVTRVTLEVPIGALQVDVPVEFRNIPLP